MRFFSSLVEWPTCLVRFSPISKFHQRSDAHIVTGRKRLFVGSFFLFSIFCLASGFSQTALTIDILNGVLGLISASSVPPAVGMLGSIYEKPSARKNAAFACFSAGNPLGFVMGTILGGLAASLSNWRAAFWLLAAVFFVLTIISIFIVPRDTADKEPLNWQSLKRFDLLGTVLTISGIGMFCAALTLGGTAADGWKTAYVLVLLFLGVALMIAFVFWELWFEWPLIPMDIWKDRNFTLSLGVMMLGFMSFETAVFFMALFFQDVWHMSSLMVAVHLLPMAINGIIVNIVAGLVLHRISNKLLMFIGTIANTVAVLLFALNRESSSYWWFCFVGFTIIVIGADFEFNVANMYVMSSMPVSQQSVAGGIFQTAARLSTSVCFGISTAVFNAVKKDPNMPSYWDPATQPYTATIWVSLAFAILSVCLVPFLTIGTQGGNINEHNDDSPVNEPNEKP